MPFRFKAQQVTPLVATLMVTILFLATSNQSVFASELKATSVSYFSGLNTDAGKTVTQFHNALTAGNAKLAASLLAEDVMVLEGGHAQRSAKEYQAHHLMADIAFLKEVKSTVVEHHVWVNGDAALSSARTKTVGSYKGRPINNQGIETIGLKKIKGQWIISYIHWS